MFFRERIININLERFLSIKERENFDILLLYYFCKSGERDERKMGCVPN